MIEFSPYIYLIIGFVILIISGDFIVRGGVSLAKRFNIPTFVIGLTVISFGTSAPELIVSINASLSGVPDIAIGNVVGSNIANIALVLGITAIILPLPVKKPSILFDWAYMLFSIIAFYLLTFYDNTLNWYDASIFLILILTYVVISIRKTKDKTEKQEGQPDNIFLAIFFLFASAAGLYFGSDLLVTNASVLAKNFGVSDYIISVTVIAFGTSVPELATSVIAALKKQTDISIGNIVGSNIFNIFMILGVTGVISEIPIIDTVINSDVFWVLGIYMLLLLFIIPVKAGIITRVKGAGLLLSYAIYLFFLLK